MIASDFFNSLLDMHALKVILYKEQVIEQLCLKDIILNDVLD